MGGFHDFSAALSHTSRELLVFLLLTWFLAFLIQRVVIVWVKIQGLGCTKHGGRDVVGGLYMYL